MRILMINSCCGIRSTGRICTDLAEALERNGHIVRVAYGRGNVPEKYQKYSVKIGNKLSVFLHAVLARVFDADGRGSLLATRKFIKWIETFNPDVIHLHNIHGYYINSGMLFKYIKNNNIKTIWTLHDMWSFTGHSCTCDFKDCEKWKQECGRCPLHNQYPKSIFDFSKQNFARKRKLFSGVGNMNIVTPSKWLADLVSESFLKNKKITVIPNGIDIEQFRPLKNDFKKYFNIEDKIMLLGCSSIWEQSKGLNDFVKLSKQVDSRFKIVLVGLSDTQIKWLPKNIIAIKRTESIKELANVYSAADIFLNLTYRDNYPTVNIEALSCGTPVITYDTGGSKECLDGRNGICFPQGDVDGITDFLNNQFSSDIFSVKVDGRFGFDTNALKYLDLGVMTIKQ